MRRCAGPACNEALTGQQKKFCSGKCRLRGFRQRNPDKRYARTETPEQAREYRRRWRKKNPEYFLDYRRKNRGAFEEYRARRGERLLAGATENWSVYDLVDRDGLRCYLCNTDTVWDHPDKRFRPSVDHVIPLSLGGSNTLNNLRVAHMACNSKKHARLIEPGSFPALEN